MKKLFVILASIILMIGVSSCNSCTNRSTEPVLADVETVDSLYSYKHSVLGILETVKEDYSDAEFKAEDI